MLGLPLTLLPKKDNLKHLICQVKQVEGLRFIVQRGKPSIRFNRS